MDHHERLAIEIALSDLRYVAGSVLQSGGGPKSWPFVQWATAVGFEAQKHLDDVHDVRFELDWEDEFAAAARHGSKFFDGGPTQLDRVVKDFNLLAAATHLSFFPPDRLGGPIFDFLRALCDDPGHRDRGRVEQRAASGPARPGPAWSTPTPAPSPHWSR